MRMLSSSSLGGCTPGRCILRNLDLKLLRVKKSPDFLVSTCQAPPTQQRETERVSELPLYSYFLLGPPSKKNGPLVGKQIFKHSHVVFSLAPLLGSSATSSLLGSLQPKQLAGRMGREIHEVSCDSSVATSNVVFYTIHFIVVL